MARLPVPGSDDGTWGEVLNEYLTQSHNADGTLKAASVPASALQSGSVNASKIGDGTITEAKLHTDVRDKLNAVAAGGSTNLSASTSSTTVTIASDTGTDATIPAATTLAAGALTASDKTKLDGLAPVATSGSYTDLSNRPTIPAQFAPIAGSNVTLSGTYPNVTISATPGAGVTDLSATTSATTVTVASSTGADATVPAATTSAAGVLTASDKTKLDGIASGAQVNTVTSVATRTGAVTLTASDVGLANVNNTSDANKPVSTATQTALDGKTDVETTNDLTNRVTDVENGKMDINYRYWSGTGGVGTWGVRPSVPAGRHVDAYSTQDVLAPAPPDAVAGDMWFRHPEAV